MQAGLKVLVAVAILVTMTFEVFEVEAAELNFQELRRGVAMPVLPEKIRYRNSRRGPTRIIVHPKTFPKFRQQEWENTSPTYVQRHPKRPPIVYVPRRPTSYPGQRGSIPKKNFGPPRARYVH